jgi:hypothetical protein
MKKMFYALLAVSIVFASCKKEEDDIATPPAAPSIVGGWTPTSAEIDYSQTLTVAGNVVESGDTTYTMTPTSEEWEFENAEFTSDGQMISDGDTNSYTHSGTVLTITEDDETETHTCTITSTTLTVIMSNSEEEIIDYMGQEGIISTNYNMTLNCTRQ